MKTETTEKQEDLERIQQFVKNGNLKAVVNWIESGKPVFCSTGQKLSPLANCIRFKRRVIFAKLLELDYSECPKALVSCLSYAVRMEILSISRLINIFANKKNI